ncbi:MAG: hypothetical protein HUK06_07055 [Bacteroidaceae bacterium]|nr:hypothetical protein [Bacteroidaceae bacterium]
MDTLKLKFIHPSASQADKAEITLDRFDANDFTIRRDGNVKKFRLTFSNLSFSKELYKPVEIDAAFILSDAEGKQLPLPAELCSYFRECTVSLLHVVETPGAATKTVGVLENGIVTEVKPVYGAHASVTMTICSPDYRLTLDKYCRSYTGKRFFKDVVVPQLENEPWNISVAGTKDAAGNKQTTNLRVLGYGETKEMIQPYMVQYNESLYDFIARVAHRCGEFMYYENGSLHIGLPWQKVSGAPKDKKVDSESVVTDGKGSIDDPKIVNVLKCSRVTYLDKRTRHEGVPTKAFYRNNTTIDLGKADMQASIPEYPYDSNIGHDWAMVKQNRGALESSDNQRKSDWKGKAIEIATTGLNRESIGGTAIQMGMKWGMFEKDMAHNAKILNMLNDRQFVDKSLLWNGEDSERIAEQRDEEKSYLYEISTDPAKVPDNKQSHYGPFCNISDDDNKRFLYFDNAFYAAIADAATYGSANTIEVNMGEYYSDVFVGDIVRLSNEDATYVVTAVRRKTTPVYYYEVADDDAMDTGDELSELIRRDRVEYVLEIVPLFTADDLKILPSGANLQCNAANGAFAVFPPMREESDIRTSGPQRAFVTCTEDNTSHGHVSLRYTWQKPTDDPSPWVRMKCDYAGADDFPGAGSKSLGDVYGGGSMFFRPDVGTEVLVGFLGDNVEQPYVIGQLFNKSQMQPGETFAMGGDYNHAIISRNHHGIYFHDPCNAFEALGSLSPIINTINKIGVVNSLSPLMVNSNKDDKYWAGGITLRDRFGIYSISMSSDKRNITVNSPLGDVKIDAFTGITISAPAGDINFVGKNISLKAGNQITISSGENIDREWWDNPTSSFAKDLAKGAISAATTAVKSVADIQVVDMALVRTLYECIVKPIEGTLNFTSRRYLTVTAGLNNVVKYPGVDGERDNEDFGGVNTLNSFMTDLRECGAILCSIPAWIVHSIVTIHNLCDLIGNIVVTRYIKSDENDGRTVKAIFQENYISFVGQWMASRNRPQLHLLVTGLTERPVHLDLQNNPNQQNNDDANQHNSQVVQEIFGTNLRDLEDSVVLVVVAKGSMQDNNLLTLYRNLLQSFPGFFVNNVPQKVLSFMGEQTIPDQIKTYLPNGNFDKVFFNSIPVLCDSYAGGYKETYRIPFIKDFYNKHKPPFLPKLDVPDNCSIDEFKRAVDGLRLQESHSWFSAGDLLKTATEALVGMSWDDIKGKQWGFSKSQLKPDKRGMLLFADNDDRTFFLKNGTFNALEHSMVQLRRELRISNFADDNDGV